MTRVEIGLRNREAVFKFIESTGDVSAAGIANATGICIRAVHKHVKLLKEARRIYISDWTKNKGTGGAWCPYYSAGESGDVKRPTGLRRAWEIRTYARIKHQHKVNRLGGANNPFASLTAQIL